MADAELSSTERRLYVSFLENLGIFDDKQNVFLASLLRNVFEASFQLDFHLAPHGAALHSAVSRMQVSENPQEAPTHRWIRVVDRLGFFSDNNSHAERVVNVGLAFAYRHLEVDAVAKSNALLLAKAQPTAAHAVDEDDCPKLPPGGTVVASTRAGGTDGSGGTGGAGDELDELPPIDLPLGQTGEEEEAALPPGGLSFSNLPPLSDGEMANGAGFFGGPTTSVGGSIATAALIGGDGAAKGAPAEPDQDVPLPHGGSTLTLGGRASSDGRTVRSSEALAAAGRDVLGHLAPVAEPEDGGALEAGSGGIDENEDEAILGASSDAPPHVVYDRQPTVVPTEFAVKTVAAVLKGLQDRLDGMAVLRQLLDDRVLVLGRSSPRPVRNNGTPWPGGVKGERAALALRTDGWWPQWRAPQDLPNSYPPVGTVAHTFNRKRASVSSRWVILVDLGGMNDTIKGLFIRSARFFHKDALVAFETVQRLWGKAPMRLPVVVACMLLLATKEEGYGTTLADLAAAGRSSIPKNTPLLSASCHEFKTTAIAAPMYPSRPSGGAADDRHPPALAPEDPLHGASAEDLSKQYAEMAVALANEAVATKAQAQANRVRLRAAGRAPNAATAAFPAAAARPALAPASVAASTTRRVPATTSFKRLPPRPRSQSAGPSAPPGAKRPRVAKRKSVAGGAAGAPVQARPSGGSSAVANNGVSFPAGAASRGGADGIATATAGASGVGTGFAAAGRGVPVRAAAEKAPAAAPSGPASGASALVRLVLAPAVVGGALAAAAAVTRDLPGAPVVLGGGSAGAGVAGAVGSPPPAPVSAGAGLTLPSVPAPLLPRTLPALSVGNDAATLSHSQVVSSLSSSPSLSCVDCPLASLLSVEPLSDATGAPGSAPLPRRSAAQFAEEYRQRRERVESDLRDTHSSITGILSSRHESWGK